MQLRDEHERVPNAFQMRLYSSVTPHLQSMRTTSVCTVQLRDKHHERVPNAFVLKCQRIHYRDHCGAFVECLCFCLDFLCFVVFYSSRETKRELFGDRDIGLERIEVFFC